MCAGFCGGVSCDGFCCAVPVACVIVVPLLIKRQGVVSTVAADSVACVVGGGEAGVLYHVSYDCFYGDLFVRTEE